MKNITIIFIALLVSGCSIKNWDRHDQLLFTSFSVLHTVDILQTREIMKDDNGYDETNPCLGGLGRDEATAAMVLGYGVVYLAAEYIPEWRTEILTGFNVISGVCVINNATIGVGLSF